MLPILKAEFIVFSQETYEKKNFKPATNLNIFLETVIEESNINHNEDLGHFFIFCMN